MILQALVHYYEELLAHGKLAAPGWSDEKVSWALEIAQDGQILSVYNVQTDVTRGKKKSQVPQIMRVPEQAKKSVNIIPTFLCGNRSYFLGIDTKGKPARTLQCFDACKELHLAVLKDTPGKAAEAVRNFFINWQPEQASENPILAPQLAEILKGGNIVFQVESGPRAQDDADIQVAWQRYHGHNSSEMLVRCMVTGQMAPLARLHPNIKGVAGTKSFGAAIVSFNETSFCSYGHEQGANAPVGTYATFAYTQALNYLLADHEHVQFIGDTTVVCWAENAESVYQDATMAMLFGADGFDTNAMYDMLEKLANGKAADWDGIMLTPGTHFYVLGLAPNAARLSVRFFWQDTFGEFAKNLKKHYKDLEIVRPSYETVERVSPYWLMLETVRKSDEEQKKEKPKLDDKLTGDLLYAILNGAEYPAEILYKVMERIRVEHIVSPNKAAIIKAYYLRTAKKQCPKEVFTVALDKKNYECVPYALGCLFAVLEELQEKANGETSTTINSSYFSAAVSTPATVFPTLVMLGQKHLNKLEKNQRIYYNKKLSEIMAHFPIKYPAFLTLSEQGTFEIGYYHQLQERYTKKEEA